MRSNKGEMSILFVIKPWEYKKYTNPIAQTYHTKVIHSIEAMEKYINRHNVDLIVIDGSFINTNSDEVLIQTICKKKILPVIVLADSQDDAIRLLEFGISDFIIKPITVQLLDHRINTSIKFIQESRVTTRMNVIMYDKLKERSKDLFKIQTGILGVLSEVIEFRDFDTTSDSLKFESYMELMIRRVMETPNPYQREVGLWNMDEHILSSQLHDIGKIGIPEYILLKSQALTPVEYQEMQKHVNIGVGIIDRILERVGNNSYLETSKKYIESHHEHWDGSGYPNNLSGTDIPLEGRILHIIDTYDTLTSLRPYRKSNNHDLAISIINEGCGTSFDPHLIKILNDISLQLKNYHK